MHTQSRKRAHADQYTLESVIWPTCARITFTFTHVRVWLSSCPWGPAPARFARHGTTDDDHALTYTGVSHAPHEIIVCHLCVTRARCAAATPVRAINRIPPAAKQRHTEYTDTLTLTAFRDCIVRACVCVYSKDARSCPCAFRTMWMPFGYCATLHRAARLYTSWVVGAAAAWHIAMRTNCAHRLTTADGGSGGGRYNAHAQDMCGCGCGCNRRSCRHTHITSVCDCDVYDMCTCTMRPAEDALATHDVTVQNVWIIIVITRAGRYIICSPLRRGVRACVRACVIKLFTHTL